jgi:hypothetical protein
MQQLHRSIVLCAAAAMALAPSGAGAQTATVGDSIHAAKTLFTWRDGVLAAGFTGLTVVMFPADRSLAQRLQDSSTQANHFLKNASRNIQYYADPGSVVIGVSLYAVGRVAKWRAVAALGLHGTEAVVISGIVTAMIKDAAGRARPYVSLDTSPHDFGLARGLLKGGGYQCTTMRTGRATSSSARRSERSAGSRLFDTVTAIPTISSIARCSECNSCRRPMDASHSVGRIPLTDCNSNFLATQEPVHVPPTTRCLVRFRRRCR